MNRYGKAFASHVNSIRPARMWVISVAQTESHLQPDQLDDLALAASELFTNAVEHGSGSDVSVSIDTPSDGSRLELTVVSGRTHAIPHVPDFQLDSSTGRGLRIVQQICTSLTFDATHDSVIVKAVFDARGLLTH